MRKVHPSRFDSYEVDRIFSEEEEERRKLEVMAQRDVASMAYRMLVGKDRKRISRLMGIRKATFDDKVRKGRFTASEFLMLSYLCGFQLRVEEKFQLSMLLDEEGA